MHRDQINTTQVTRLIHRQSLKRWWVAEYAGIHRTTLRRWLSGEISRVDRRRVARLACVLNVPAEEITYLARDAA